MTVALFITGRMCYQRACLVAVGGMGLSMKQVHKKMKHGKQSPHAMVAIVVADAASFQRGPPGPKDTKVPAAQQCFSHTKKSETNSFGLKNRFGNTFHSETHYFEMKIRPPNL